ILVRGRVARYAWGEDYHRLIEAKLGEVAAYLVVRAGAATRVFVDHGRMIDRAVAVRSGLGWYGRNTNVLTRRFGSWIFLAEVLTDAPLVPDAPLQTHCGSCTRCVAACPTGALVAPGVLDNDRCISFLTIELRGPIPRPLRPLMGDWVFGCDVCQEVCPVNRNAEARAHPKLGSERGIGPRPDLLALLRLTEEEFAGRFRPTPIWRTRRRGLLRNVCVALGNRGDRAAVPALSRALADAEPLVRQHAAWALGRLGGAVARQSLTTALDAEQDPLVRDEISQVMSDE
ncbi:MAG: tRNA epoxyqueuosine(34) reductase QueG, partial [Chloroflexi bacterium]|nr:tRNA epoxyqueuosine(34) reductase QueG [Chloroflexota bacterium]